MNENNKIALFYRVSSEQQVTKGSGLVNQKTIGRRLAKELGFEIEEFDEGVQSTHNVSIESREVVLRLLKRISDKKDPIRNIWVYNTDRFGRDSVESSKVIQILHTYNVKIYQGSSTIPKDVSSFADKFMMEIFSTIASYDNSLRRMRSNDGKRNSLLRGNTYVGGTVPFGFTVIDKNLHIEENESEIVRELFRRYSKNTSTNELKKWLDKNAKIKPRRSVTWSQGTIIKMLQNKLYNGTQEWQWKEKLPNGEVKLIGEPIKLKIPKIVDDDTFKTVQSRINEITSLRIRNNKIKDKSLLSGLLKCRKCNLLLSHRYREHIGSGNHYYGRCTEHQWRTNDKVIPKSECLIKKSLRIEETDELVLNTLINLIQKSKQIREEYRTELLNQKEKDKVKSREQTNKIKKRIRVLKDLIDNLEEKIAITEVQLSIKEINKSLAKKIITLSKKEIHEKSIELEELNRNLSVLYDGSKWIDWIDKMSMDVSSVKNKSKRLQKEWVKKFIKRIYVEYIDEIKSHKLDVEFHVGLVNDNIKKIGNDNKGLPLYKLTEGDNKMELRLEWVKRTEGVDKEHLNKIIGIIKSQLSVGLTNNQICDYLNTNNIKTIRGKTWKKDTLIKFRNKYLKDSPPK